MLTKDDFKKMLIAVLVGAAVAFFSSLFDGLINLLQGWGNNLAGGAVASALLFPFKKSV